MWSPVRGQTKIVASNNLVSESRCPRSSRSPMELRLMDGANTEIPLSSAPAVLTLQEVDTATDLHIVGTFEGNFVLSEQSTLRVTLFSPTLLWRVSAPSVLHLCLKYCTTRTPKIFPPCILL